MISSERMNKKLILQILKAMSDTEFESGEFLTFSKRPSRRRAISIIEKSEQIWFRTSDPIEVPDPTPSRELSDDAKSEADRRREREEHTRKHINGGRHSGRSAWS